jgi:hypothetical protein
MWSRDPFLRRGRRCAQVTIPAILPEEGHSGSNDLPTPHNSIGARGVNNLASKLLLALLPPNESFFKLSVDEITAREISEEQGAKQEIDAALATIERVVMNRFESRPFRTSLFEALKLLLVTGNALLHVMPDGDIRVFRLDRYVVRRDPSGSVLEIIIRESVDPETLSPKVKALLGDVSVSHAAAPTAPNVSPAAPGSVDLYTYIYREGKKMKVFQEIAGKMIPETKSAYPIEKCPLIPLRFSKQDGEDYGRGYCEEYLGDLIACDGLSKAILDAAAISAKILFLVSPNSTLRATDMSEAPTGAFRTGRLDDVGVLQVDKRVDLQTAQSELAAIYQRLALAFLLNTAVQRAGERVTAEEIRYMAQELEDALGGTYSILSQELQLPLVRVVMADMERSGKLPSLPDDIIAPIITTGLEALGRGHDLSKLQTFTGVLAQTLGPEVLATYMHVDALISRTATALGIIPDGLIKTPEERAAEQQQQQMMMLAQQLGPNAITQMGQLAGKQMDQQVEAPSQ